MGRVRYATRNIIFGFLGSGATTLLNFILRQVFITHLGDTLLGVQDLYSEILTMLSLAELARGSCFTLKQLAINGNDLKPLGYRGPELGRVLQMLLDRVMDGRLSNNREDLLAEAEKLKTN